jgi:hypothetical protein
MRIKTHSQPRGSVLLVTLLTAAIIIISLASYLGFVANQNLSVARSLAWNNSLPVSEAGLEEALTQIHYNGYTNLSANGWTLATDGFYHKTRSIPTGGYCDVAINPVNPPVIYSTGYVPAPMTPSSQLGLILAQVVSRTPAPASLKRRIRLKTAGGGSGAGAAVISKGAIYLSGNNVTIDSFDSSDPISCPLGRWDPATTIVRDHGDVLTDAADGLTSNGKPLYALDVGDADIKGHVTTGPSGTVNVTSGGSVGDVAWVSAGTVGVESGWQSHDGNLDIHDVQPPDFSTGYFTPSSKKVGKVNYSFYMGQSGNYKLSSLSGAVYVAGDVTLWVTDSVNLGSSDYIYLAPGATLKLYVSAPSATIGGQGIINTDGYARSFQYLGLPTNTSVDYKGNSSFTGVINAPQADVKIGGGGTSPYDFVGSCVVNSLTMNGHFSIHYDEALRPVVINNGYLVGSWNEVDPNGPMN